MEFTRRYLPMEWEERWRREKERRKRVIEEGGEGIEQDNRELRRIVAYNDSRMGLTSRRSKKEGSNRMSSTDLEGTGEHVSNESLGAEGHNVHTCLNKTYHKEVFEALKEFLDSSLLTDLTLTTGNQKSFHVHSLILAAVSSFFLERLRDKSEEESDSDGDFGVQRWTIHLGSEVDHIGLQGVVEFAYTGFVSPLNSDNVAQIKAAAQALSVPRLLDLCNKEQREKNGESFKKEAQAISALQQMKITLQSIEQLWADRVGCDVILDVDGTFFHG